MLTVNLHCGGTSAARLRGVALKLKPHSKVLLDANFKCVQLLTLYIYVEDISFKGKYFFNNRAEFDVMCSQTYSFSNVANLDGASRKQTINGHRAEHEHRGSIHMMGCRSVSHL